MAPQWPLAENHGPKSRRPSERRVRFRHAMFRKKTATAVMFRLLLLLLFSSIPLTAPYKCYTVNYQPTSTSSRSLFVGPFIRNPFIVPTPSANYDDSADIMASLAPRQSKSTSSGFERPGELSFFLAHTIDGLLLVNRNINLGLVLGAPCQAEGSLFCGWEDDGAHDGCGGGMFGCGTAAGFCVECAGGCHVCGRDG